jgi:uncharacterized hydrophobic protein (TIGR00271 family)
MPKAQWSFPHPPSTFDVRWSMCDVHGAAKHPHRCDSTDDASRVTDEQPRTAQARHASVRARVREDSAFDHAYAIMNALGTVVACYGLLSGSSAVVIGAMIITVLLGPIAGIGLALVDADNALLGRASATLAGGVAIVLGISLVIGIFHRDIPATAEMMIRTSPNAFDLMIGLAGGAAAGYAAASNRAGMALVGVAAATALVPPFATCSLFLARGEWSLSGGALLLAVTNVVAIQFACSVVFFLTGFRKITWRGTVDRPVLWHNVVSIGLLIVLGTVLTANLHSTLSRLRYEGNVRAKLKLALVGYPGARLADLRFTYAKARTTVHVVVRGPEPLSAGEISRMKSALPPAPAKRPSALTIRYVHTTVLSAMDSLGLSDEPEPGRR